MRLTERGIERTEQFFVIENLGEEAHTDIRHGLEMALRAHALMKRDRDYVVKNGEVLIVDPFTGRILPGRRYSNGLHQALEAKEHVEIRTDSMTLASITYQSFFNKYSKKAGMTGTGKSEEQELLDCYGMRVAEIPTNRPVIRKDLPDQVFSTKKEKYQAVWKEISRIHRTGQPVLVGTASIEVSELLSRGLRRRGIPHQVLNAKLHEKEAEIISHAGEAGAVTIATNMAGRGTDIKLDPEAKRLGGLAVIGTERHESRRIDDQLRGRSGRQGDPGRSQFFLSGEDDLFRLYGNRRHESAREADRAQKRIEQEHYQMRKDLLEYDRVNSEQRELIYGERNRLLDGADIKQVLGSMAEGFFRELFRTSACKVQLSLLFGPSLPPLPSGSTEKKLRFLLEQTESRLNAYLSGGQEWEKREELLRTMILKAMDQAWIRHLDGLERLRTGIGLQSYGQKDPKTEYQLAAYEQFEQMLAGIRDKVVRGVLGMIKM